MSSKHKPSMNTIANELQGASVFFQKPTSTSGSVPHPLPEQTQSTSGEHPHTRTDEHMNARTPEQANTRTGERPIKRQSYNVYQDQHQALTRIEAKSRLSGKPITISDMVRKAIEDYLSNQK